MIMDTDSDTNTDMLEYWLSVPRPGRVLRNGAPCESFSQTDVDHGIVVYHHQYYQGKWVPLCMHLI